MKQSRMDELVGIVRTAATKRRQGLLVVEEGEVRIEASLASGRIVRVAKAGEEIEVWAGKRLARTAGAEPAAGLSLNELKERFGETAVGEAVAAYELDAFYSVALLADPNVDFYPRSVEMRSEFNFPVTPAQLLLDLVEVENDEERFLALFGRLDDEYQFIRACGEAPAQGTERRVWELSAGRISLRALYDKAVISDYWLKRALLSLHDRSLIQIAENEIAAAADSRDERRPQVLTADAAGAATNQKVLPLEEQAPRYGPVAAEPEAFSLNDRLLDSSGVQSASIAVLAVFFLLLALFLPSMVNDWFNVIGEFTSQGSYGHGRLDLGE